MTPSVAFLCPTFGRFPKYGHLLGECVAAFLAQDYPKDRIELVILNDAKEQTLVCDAPGVRVINLKERVPTLGAKRNLLATATKAEILLPCDDDDISLPGRTEQAVKFLTDRDASGIPYDYWNPRGYWYVNPGETDNKLSSTHSIGVSHNASAFRRGKLRYPELTQGEDQTADNWAKRHLRVNPNVITPYADRWAYIYRWGQSDYHISGFGTVEASQAAYDRRGAEPGTYRIEPRATRDWVGEVRRALKL